MNVTTRAGARRENDESSVVNTINTEHKTSAKKPQDAMQIRSYLLELPSEAESMTLYGTRVCNSKPPEPWATRGWQYFALTQTCRQIRDEYRPLWLRAKSLWLLIQDLGQFVDTFMPTESELKTAPKTIQVAWFHDTHGHSEKRWDITPLIRLLACRPDFSFEFIPYRVAMNIVPDIGEICDYCTEMIENDVQGFTDNDNLYGNCECVPEEWDYKDWEINEHDEMAYMDHVQVIAQNKNTVWLDDVRNGDITVEFFKKSKSGRITIVIHCKNSFRLDQTLRKDARDLLTKWGLDGSLHGFSYNPYDYMVLFELKKRFVSNSGRYETTETVTHEVCINKIK